MSKGLLDLMSPSDTTNSIDRAHRVLIRSSSGVTLRPYLPQEVSIALESEWGAPYADVGGGGTIANLASLVGGQSFKTKPMSAQAWSGSTPVETTMELEFIAIKDPAKEVLEPMVQAMKLVTPGIEKDGMRFDPPGPTFIGYLKSLNNETAKKYARHLERVSGDGGVKGEEVTITLGKFMRFKNVIVTRVEPVIKTAKLAGASGNHKGLPMQVTVAFTFRTYTALAKDDIDTMFDLNQIRVDD